MTFDAVLGFLKKSWPLLVSAALVISLVISRWELRNANDHLATEAHFRTVVQTELGAPDPKIETLTVVIHDRVKESADRKAALTQISTETVAAKKRADVADATLKAEQRANAKKFAEAHREIAALQSRKPSGNADKDQAALEEDSKAAWKGWK